MPDNNGRIRYDIFFNHPNRASFIFFWGALGCCYLSKNIIKKIFMCFLTLVVFYFTDTRTIIYLECIYIILELLSPIKKINNFINVLPKITYFFIVLFNFFIVYAYIKNWDFAYAIDKFTNQRIFYSCRAFRIYGITLFGQYIEMKTSLYGVNQYDWLILDSFYMYCVYGYGILYLIFLFIDSIWVSKIKDNKKSIFMIIWCIYAFFELSNMNFIVAFAPILGANIFKVIKGDKK